MMERGGKFHSSAYLQEINKIGTLLFPHDLKVSRKLREFSEKKKRPHSITHTYTHPCEKLTPFFMVKCRKRNMVTTESFPFHTCTFHSNVNVCESMLSNHTEPSLYKLITPVTQACSYTRKFLKNRWGSEFSLGPITNLTLRICTHGVSSPSQYEALM